MSGRAFVLLGVLSALPEPARAEVAIQAGLHVGFIFGRGWTVGPTLEVGWPIVDTHPFSARWSTVLTGGLAVGGDVSFAAGPPNFLFRAGPVLAAFQTCPAFVIPVGVDLVWSFERERPSTIGWDGHLAFLVAALHPMPDYLHPAPAPTFLIGPSYRLTALHAGLPAHEVGADARFLFHPGGGAGLGYCGGD